MIASATTTVTIYRGQTTDEWGDPIDTNTIVATGVIASITEVNANSFTEVTNVPRVIRKAIGRLSAETDIRANDRILDETNDETWIIRSISRLQNPVCAMDWKVELQQVG